MNLYEVFNEESGYYDKVTVIADNEEDALEIGKRKFKEHANKDDWNKRWCGEKYYNCKYSIDFIMKIENNTATDVVVG